MNTGTRTWEGCAGAYAIQEEADPYVRIVEGSVSNVIGLRWRRPKRSFTGWRSAWHFCMLKRLSFTSEYEEPILPRSLPLTVDSCPLGLSC